jgi:hypothetical protein
MTQRNPVTAVRPTRTYGGVARGVGDHSPYADCGKMRSLRGDALGQGRGDRNRRFSADASGRLWRDVIVLLKTKGLFDECRLDTAVLIWNYACLLVGAREARISNPDSIF